MYRSPSLFVKSRLLLEQLARHDTENMLFGLVIVDDAAFVANLQTERETLASMFLNQCWAELFELFEYSNSWDRIVLFGIRIRSFSGF